MPATVPVSARLDEPLDEPLFNMLLEPIPDRRLTLSKRSLQNARYLLYVLVLQQ